LAACVQVTDGPLPGQFVVTAMGRGEPLADVEVCATTVTECVMTDAEGKAALDEPPADEEVSLTLEQDGFASFLFGDLTDDTFDSSPLVNMWADSFISGFCDTLSTACPFPTTGIVAIFMDPPFAGATFDLVGATGKPYYGVAGLEPSADLEATEAGGWGGFVEVNVAAGEVQVEIGGTAERCEPVWGWPANADNTIRIPVRAGYVTGASVTCPLP